MDQGSFYFQGQRHGRCWRWSCHCQILPGHWILEALGNWRENSLVKTMLQPCAGSWPIGSMYGIYANIWGILMANVTIYSIHGSYGWWNPAMFMKFRMLAPKSCFPLKVFHYLGKYEDVLISPRCYQWLVLVLMLFSHLFPIIILYRSTSTTSDKRNPLIWIIIPRMINITWLKHIETTNQPWL